MTNLIEMAKNAKEAAIKLSTLDSETKNEALKKVADALESKSEAIFKANEKDLEEAQEMLKEGTLTTAVYNRLKLDKNKIRDMIQGIRDMITLEDPVNKILWKKELAKDLILTKITCPIGVIGVIFEARPDVIAQISSLSIKSANAVLLKGGKEAQHTNTEIFNIIENTLNGIEKFPKNAINLLYTREDVAKMLDMEEYINLIIPRGGNSLVKFIQSNTKIPVLGHADGICHIYIDESADIDKVLPIVIDSKCQYPSACNAVETILINQNELDRILPSLISELQKNEVKIIGDEAVQKYSDTISLATEKDWKTEYGEKIVSIKTVNDVYEAISHINKYGSGHTDSIITENKGSAGVFRSQVDSAGVFCNASTRFSDGFRYGFGAEVGISTNKTHARGPVGLEGLTIYKYDLVGNGDIVADFATGTKSFTHKMLEE